MLAVFTADITQSPCQLRPMPCTSLALEVVFSRWGKSQDQYIHISVSTNVAMNSTSGSNAFCVSDVGGTIYAVNAVR